MNDDGPMVSPYHETVTKIPKTIDPMRLTIENRQYVLYLYDDRAFEYDRDNHTVRFYGSWNSHNHELIMSTLSWLMRNLGH